MSWFLFGTFNSTFDKELSKQVESYANEKDVYIWFNEETKFYKYIELMIKDEKSDGEIKFAITSKNQLYNSEDLLLPYDKFDNEVLFADETREFYKKCCRENIEIVFDCLKNLIDRLNVKQLEIFIVDGYGYDFERKVCSLDEMKQDLLCQIEEYSTMDSCIYCIKQN